MNSTIKKMFIILLQLVFAFGIIACNKTTTSSFESNIIDISESEIYLSIGSQYQIDYQLNIENPTGLEIVTFSSNDESIASVSSLGLVEGKSKGVTEIILSYLTSQEVITVIVSDEYHVISPSKTTYHVGDDISLIGGKIITYDEEGNVFSSVKISSDMSVTYDFSTSGRKMVTFVYQGITLGFEVLVLSEVQEESLFDDFIILNSESILGEKMEFSLTKSNTVDFLSKINNIYDYEEVSVYALIQLPNQEYVRIDAFWYQEFSENITTGVVNPSNNLEGKVNDMSDDYDYILTYVKENNPQFRFRYLPTQMGSYDMTVYIQIEGDIIQEFHKTFEISSASDDYLGIVEVDSTNQRHFVFSEGGTYIPAGQNVAWYTSKDRQYYDYLNWFQKMGEAKMNYARVWMAPWGFSLYWDDVYNYDERQDQMYSLDRTLEIADDNDIYIQLCLLNHGMFSQEVNPMWPDSNNTWYTSKYGANPYSEYLSNPGLFFTSSEAKASFKNQIRYIIARFGYSDTIMAFELFNEVDWIETYTAVYGTAWHKEMSEFIKSIDPNHHMVTTSTKSDSFLSSVYQVFNLDSIDYVNVHSYGIYNHTSALPNKQSQGFTVFEKPILYDEVGYSGNGGSDQMAKDPNNVTLHQELWAGAMGGGCGTGMNWWWESWIEPFDLYDQYTGVATYVSLLDLTAEESYAFVYGLNNEQDILTVSRTDTSYMGYLVDNRLYLYIFDTSYTLQNQNVVTKNNTTITTPVFEQGIYQLTFMNTYTGETISSQLISVSNASTITLTIPSFNQDIALILTPVE